MPFRLYVDTCILVAYYYKDPLDDHKMVVDCLKIIRDNPRRTTLDISDFTFTEFVKVLQNKEGISESDVFRCLSEMVRLKKIGKEYPFRLIDAEGRQRNYSFNDFFVGLQDILLDARPGIADAIHAQIMLNNNRKRILTFDTDDFNEISGIETLHPNEIEGFVENIHFKKTKKGGRKGHLKAQWRKTTSDEVQ
ncbi:MAG: PIN domain-containing protein [Thermoplasmata archaeon]